MGIVDKIKGLFGDGENSSENQEPQEPSEATGTLWENFASGSRIVGRKIASGGLKGAIIGAVAVPAIAGAAVLASASTVPFLLPALGVTTALSGTLQGFLTTQAIGLAIKGAMAGAAVGGAVGATSIATVSDDIQDESEREAFLKLRKKQQMMYSDAIEVGQNTPGMYQGHGAGYSGPALPHRGQGAGQNIG